MGLAVCGRACPGQWGLALVATWLAGCAEPPPETHSRGQAATADFRMATYNVHYLDLAAGAEDEWGLPAWQARRGPVVAQVRRMGADIVAFQELETRGQGGGADVWERWLLDALPEYRSAASGFGRGVSVGQPIFYRPGAFRLLDDGFVFFTRPDANFRSIRAIAGYPDAVTWARLEHRESGEVVSVFNVHLHFIDTTQRLRSARRVVELAEAAQARGDRVLVAGDFNARRNSRALRIFYEGGFARAAQRGATFHFNTGMHLFGAIDHLLHDEGAVPVGRAGMATAKIGGVWPSDHYPVWVDFRLGPRG
uniref:endonuclease/exonuclease/phosphatase family protein n=1 Tax=Roseovarius indicus TaxID=540747 RepID=UPI003B51E671